MTTKATVTTDGRGVILTIGKFVAGMTAEDAEAIARRLSDVAMVAKLSRSLNEPRV